MRSSAVMVDALRAARIADERRDAAACVRPCP